MTLMKKLEGYEICDQVARDSAKDAANITKGTLPIARGGTGATSAAGILTNMGISATATELNRCDGVTSAIQTQLNGKAASSHNHSAANITSGVLPTYRGGTGITNQSDAIIAQGISGIWQWIKFNSGQAICCGRYVCGSVWIGKEYTNAWYTQTGNISFPFNFIGYPNVTCSAWTGSGLITTSISGLNSSGMNVYSLSFYLISSRQMTTTPDIMIVANGRWC